MREQARKRKMESGRRWRGERTGRPGAPVMPGAEACGWVGGRAHGVAGERGEAESRAVVRIHDDAVNVFRHRSWVRAELFEGVEMRRALRQG